MVHINEMILSTKILSEGKKRKKKHRLELFSEDWFICWNVLVSNFVELQPKRRMSIIGMIPYLFYLLLVS